MKKVLFIALIVIGFISCEPKTCSTTGTYEFNGRGFVQVNMEDTCPADEKTVVKNVFIYNDVEYGTKKEAAIKVMEDFDGETLTMYQVITYEY